MQRVTTKNKPPDFTVPESQNFGWQLLTRPQSRERNMSIVVQRFEPGGWFFEHDHDLDQYFYVTEGWFEMTIAGQTAVYQQGDLIFVPRGEPHAGRNIGEGEGELLVIDYWPSDSTSELGLEEER
jgi:quercetin dioxygenase-like cupin family protein